MEKNVNRPQRIAPDQVDDAVQEALQRVQQANQLSVEELNKANGGAIGVPIRPTIGLLIVYE